MSLLEPIIDTDTVFIKDTKVRLMLEKELHSLC